MERTGIEPVTSGLQFQFGADQGGQDMSSCDGCTVPRNTSGLAWATVVGQI
jgi:hypothetical protein